MYSSALEDWLHTRSNLTVFLIVCGTFVTLVVAAPHVRRLLGGRAPSKEVSDGASEAFKAIISFIVFLLAFSLVQVQGQLRSVEEVVAKEANTLNAMDRALLRFGADGTLALRTVLRDYARTIVQDEWPALVAGERGAKAEETFARLSRGIRTAEPVSARQQALYTQMLTYLDDLSDQRERRIDASELGLSNLYWWTLLALFALLTMLSTLMQPTVERALALGGLTCAASLLFALVLIIDSPFAGETSVSAAPISRVIGVMEARD